MKSTGIVRKVDELGRIVIPTELRRVFKIDIKDAMEIFVDNEMIILQKYKPGCIFCDNVDNTEVFEGRNICRECITKITRL